MKNIISILFISLLCLSGCSVNTPEKTTSDTNSPEAAEEQTNTEENEDILDVVTHADINYNPEDCSVLAEMADYTVLASIGEITGTSVKNRSTNERCYPYTYGKAEIMEVFKGNDEINTEIDFIRAGAVVSWEDYLVSLGDTAAEKAVMEAGDKTPEFVNCHLENDISIETGKTYLMYLVKDEDIFYIIGLAGGLREYAEGNVLNNFTGEWVTLESVISEID